MPAIPYVLPHKGECFLPWQKNGRILPLCNICLFNLPSLNLPLASKEQAFKVFQSLTGVEEEEEASVGIPTVQ